jgi:hypothetical protein
MCWSHVQRAYSKKLCHLKMPELEKSIDDDLHSLQLASSDRIFFAEFELLKKKYAKEIESNKEVNQFSGI